jgi:hypothetical protein
MIIACLGWGSLVWDPRTLAVRKEWFNDGPFAPVEFTRQSSDGRITLVIDRSAAPVRLLWAQMTAIDLSHAKESLRDREQITTKKWSAFIGSWQRGDPAPDTIPSLSVWAEARGAEAVIWTALGPKFNGKDGKSPSAEEVVAYLSKLTGPQRDHAKQYIESAPRQIDTEFRRRIEAALGWSYKSVLQ